ncbi:MAG: NAD(P)/FAD-dependent oxidoreductase [Pseudolabrys sp.]
MSEQDDGHLTWYQATQVPAAQRERLAFDLDADVCVIGAGFAGLTLAREIARRGWSVAVLEGAQIGWAASGRNTGFVLPGFSEGIDDIIERIGLDHAKQLWALSQGGVDYVRRAIADETMPGVDPVDGWLHVSKTDAGRGTLAYVERLRWLGAEVEFWPVERVRETLPSDRYFSAAHFPRAFHIHPLNYAIGLAAAAEKAGARIFEDTPAVSIDPAGVRKRVQTPAATVRAAHVVLAGNVHLGSLMPRLAATLIPLNTYVMVTEPIAGLRETVRYSGAVSDTDRADNHYRIVGDHPDEQRLLWSGCVSINDVAPQKFAKSLEAGVRRVFPQLGAVKAAHIWGGTFGRTLHRMPQIGEIQPGLWVASGFSGHGINNTAMAGELVARGIVEKDDTWHLFAPYELVWAGGKAGRYVAKALYLGRKQKALAQEAFARARERSRQRRERKIADLTAARAAGAAATAQQPAVSSAPDKG